MAMKTFFVGVKGVIRDNRGYLLLHRNYKSGDHWDIPGGRIDGNEEFEDALRRELDEELPGIVVDRIGALQGAFRLQKDIDGDTSLILLYFLVEAKIPDKIVLSDEHEAHTWVNSIKDLPDRLNPEIERILRKLLT